MIQVELKVRGKRMNEYDGWVVMHEAESVREAQRHARFLREAARLLNRVGNVRVTVDGVEVAA